MPAGAQCLATSPDCAVQAMKWGTRACSAQFHIEVEADTVENWSAIPEYAASLQSALGEDGLHTLRTGVSARQSEMADHAERLYINWLQMAAQA